MFVTVDEDTLAVWNRSKNVPSYYNRTYSRYARDLKMPLSRVKRAFAKLGWT